MKDQEEKKEKTRAQQIIDGDIEPATPQEKGWLNLRKRVSFNNMTPERAHEIRSMGGKAVQELHGEKKTAKQSIEKILTLKVTDDIIAGADLPDEIAQRLKKDNPNATLYDLIQIVAVGKAVGGNVKAMEYVRDTHGDKPVDKVDISGEIMTESDRAMLGKVAERLADPSVSLEIVKDIDTRRRE